jgi:hypothetical protein
VVGAVVVVGLLDVVGRAGSVEVVRPRLVVVDGTVVGPGVEVVEVPLAVVGGKLDGVVVATGTVSGGTSGWLVLVVLGPGAVVGTVVVDGRVVTEDELVTPVVVVEALVVVEGVVVVVVDGTVVTDVTDGSDVALPSGELVVVVGTVPAAARDRAGTPMVPAAMSSAKIVTRDPAPRRLSPLVEISEEKGITGHPRS